MSLLIGRDGDVALVEQLLFGPAPVPILTITGPSGIGKSRFVREVVDRAASAREHGAIRVAEKGDPATGRRVLLVVDEPDLTVSGARQLTSRTLQQQPDAQVLVTSLAPLRLRGERAHRLERLAPEPYGVALFTAAIGPHRRAEFDPAHIAALCVELSGLPLAVKAAAALSEAVPPEHLLRRLGEARLLDVLGDVVLPGDRTLRAAITRTYAEISDADRRILASLSALPAEFTTAAAIAALGRSEGAALAGLARLTAVGALTRSSVAGVDLRFSVPRALREMSREVMTPPPTTVTAVVRYYHAIATAATTRSVGGDDLGALTGLAGDEGALRVSADKLAEVGDTVGALEVEVAGAVAALSLRWDADAAARLDRRMHAAGVAAPPALRLHAQLLSGRLAVEYAMDLPRPHGPLVAGLLEGVAAARAHGDPALVALAAGFAVEGSVYADEPPMCERLIGPALAMQADPSLQAPLHAWAAVLQAMRGLSGPALETMEDAREQLQDAGSSRAVLAAALRVAALVPDPSGPLSLHRLLADARRMGDRHLEARALTQLARSHLDRGGIAEAVGAAADTLRLVQSAGGADAGAATVGVLAVIAECAAARGELFEAVRLETALRGIAPRASAVAFEPPGEQTGRRRKALTQTDAARAFHEASTWTLADAVVAGRALAERLSRQADADGSSPVALAAPTGTGTLTPRERDIVIRLAHGASNKVIADSLGLSAKTVMHHSLAIYRKLGVHTRAEAAVLAVRQGLVPTDD